MARKKLVLRKIFLLFFITGVSYFQSLFLLIGCKSLFLIYVVSKSFSSIDPSWPFNTIKYNEFTQWKSPPHFLKKTPYYSNVDWYSKNALVQQGPANLTRKVFLFKFLLTTYSFLCDRYHVVCVTSCSFQLAFVTVGFTVWSTDRSIISWTGSRTPTARRLSHQQARRIGSAASWITNCKKNAYQSSYHYPRQLSANCSFPLTLKLT